MKLLFVSWWLLVIGNLAEIAAVETPKQNRQSNDHRDQSKEYNVYCGLYSLYHAFQALGKDIHPVDLVKPQYISSRAGSSLEDLVRASRDFGLYAEPMEHMTCSMLRHSNCPVILHVKKEFGDYNYNHWILFLGTDSVGARICESSGLLVSMMFEELSARWDGVGIIVSNAPIQTELMWLAAGIDYVILGGVVIALIGLVYWLQENRGYLSRKTGWWARILSAVSQGRGLLTITVVLGLTYRLCVPSGFLSFEPAIRAIQDVHLATFLPKVNSPEVAELIKRPGITIVDARSVEDFEMGHLDGALNLPPNSDLRLCQRVMTEVPKTSRVLIYCQSSGCPFSGKLALKLRMLGYQNLVIFQGGWNDWKKFQKVHET